MDERVPDVANPSERRERGGRLSGDEAVLLAEQIAGWSRAGLPLPSGLRALAEEFPSGRLRRVLEGLAGALESGASLDAALASLGDRLPAHLRGLVLAGVKTGKLGEVLSRFAAHANVGTDLRRMLWLKLAYPLFALGLASAIFVFVCRMLISGYATIFRDFGVPVPRLTAAIFRIAAVVSDVWWPICQVFLGLALLWLVLNLVLTTDLRQRLLGRLPLVGTVWRLTSLADFSHLLAMLLECDIPLPEALSMAGAGVRSGDVAASSRAAAREVERGRPLWEALTIRSFYPRGFGRILAWAEGGPGLPEALHMAGEMFEARSRSQADFVSTVFSIIAVASILSGVVVTVLAVMIPMISLITKLSG